MHADFRHRHIYTMVDVHGIHKRPSVTRSPQFYSGTHISREIAIFALKRRLRIKRTDYGHKHIRTHTKRH